MFTCTPQSTATAIATANPIQSNAYLTYKLFIGIGITHPHPRPRQSLQGLCLSGLVWSIRLACWLSQSKRYRGLYYSSLAGGAERREL